MTVLEAPPGNDEVPQFENGWIVGEGSRAPFLSYAEPQGVNWSAELERLHEESSRTHFLDVWTREAILARVGTLAPQAVVVDLGCSTGFLLQDLRIAHPQTVLIGIDLVADGLRKAHTSIPSARLLQADVCNLPLGDATVARVVSANLLEHVPDDRRALAEVNRVLQPSGRAVIVVPAGPGTYDYYDRFLGHERRYARSELADKGREVGLEVDEDGYLASLLYPAFWLVKQRNRRLYGNLEGEALEQRVLRDIQQTGDSRIGVALWGVEARLKLRLRFGIRNLVVFRKGDR